MVQKLTKAESLAVFCVRGGTKIKMQPMHEGLGVCLNGSRGVNKHAIVSFLSCIKY